MACFPRSAGVDIYVTEVGDFSEWSWPKQALSRCTENRGSAPKINLLSRLGGDFEVARALVQPLQVVCLWRTRLRSGFARGRTIGSQRSRDTR